MKVDRTVRGDSLHLAFEGRIDSAWAESASRELESAIRSGRPRVDLDLDRVTFISSVGIGILVQSFTRFRAVGGVLAIVTASEPVRGMLRVAKLESMLMAAATEARAASEAHPIGSGWTGKVRRLSSVAAAPAARARFVGEGVLQATPGLVAIGHFALAGDRAGADGHFGEGLAAGGTVAVQPAEAPRPDCLASSDAGTVSFIARRAIAVEGSPSLQGEFERAEGAAVGVSSLAAALVARVGGPVAFVALGECAGAFGAWARTSPDGWRSSPEAMDDASLRKALRFAGEPMLAGESLVAAGVAAGSDLSGIGEEVAATLAEFGGVRLHAHAAVASYRPVPATTSQVEAAGRLLAEQPVRLVLHAMRGRDGRETAFERGVVFVWPLGPGGAA